MFHPGGFGESSDSHDKRPAKVDPCIIRPIIFLVCILLSWTTCLVLGLQLGFGWYAWPLGTLVVGSVFIIYSVLKWLSSRWVVECILPIPSGYAQISFNL